jgi:hypothetical protein
VFLLSPHDVSFVFLFRMSPHYVSLVCTVPPPSLSTTFIIHPPPIHISPVCIYHIYLSQIHYTNKIYRSVTKPLNTVITMSHVIDASLLLWTLSRIFYPSFTSASSPRQLFQRRFPLHLSTQRYFSTQRSRPQALPSFLLPLSPSRSRLRCRPGQLV